MRAGNRVPLHYKKALKKEADRIRHQYCSAGPPYDPFEIAQGLGIKVEIANLTRADGYVESRDGSFVVVISATSPLTRRHFTLAHELGHVFLMQQAIKGTPMNLIRYRTSPCTPWSSIHDPIEEALCNLFAAELLLPFYEVRHYLRMQNNANDKRYRGYESLPMSVGAVAPEDIFALAKRFNVSLQAAANQSVRVLGKLSSCSFWDLEATWPMPLWWAGCRTRYLREIKRLECLVEKKTELIETWNSFGPLRRAVKLQVAPSKKMRYSLVLVTPSPVGDRSSPVSL